MVFASLSQIQCTSSEGGSEALQIRALVAKQLGIDFGRVTDDAHLRHDLGADWLDRLELLTLVEDLFADVEIMDDDADQIEVVGDLIRCVTEGRDRAKHCRVDAR